MLDHRTLILALVSKLKDRRPLPPHLDYMVTIVNRLSRSPRLVLSVIPNRPDAKLQDGHGYIELPLPEFKDLNDGVRWIEDQVFEKGQDLREVLDADVVKKPPQ